MPTILVISPTVALHRSLHRALTPAHTLLDADDAVAALNLAAVTPPDLVIWHLTPPYAAAAPLTAALLARHPATRLLLTSTHALALTLDDVRTLGALDLLPDSADQRLIQQTVTRLLGYHAA
jgi:DNA-binding NarL/FixJ family response regulator